MPETPSHLIKGKDAEAWARDYLIRQGMTLVEANYRCPPGEIDLIMSESGTLVFVEVRYRADQSFGGALESITTRKQGRLRAAAMHYLQQRHGRMEVPCRIDVVLVSGALDPTGDSTGDLEVDWIPNAV